MILKKKLTKSEKVMIAMVHPKYYVIYFCKEHGVFYRRNDVKIGKCPYCKKECEIVENVQELKDAMDEEHLFY